MQFLVVSYTDCVYTYTFLFFLTFYTFCLDNIQSNKFPWGKKIRDVFKGFIRSCLLGSAISSQ